MNKIKPIFKGIFDRSLFFLMQYLSMLNPNWIHFIDFINSSRLKDICICGEMKTNKAQIERENPFAHGHDHYLAP